MRGLDEIKKVNEDPHGFHGEEHFGSKHVGPATTHDTAEEAQAEVTTTHDTDDVYTSFASHFAKLAAIDNIVLGDALETNELVEMATVATVLDTFGIKHPANYGDAKALAIRLLKVQNAGATSQDRPQPGIDQPPFIDFWADLNTRRVQAGLPEALYKEARTLFEGGVTPVGSMTFIGKQWEGLRAIPAKPVKYLGGERPQYHGQYRQTTRLGVKWHTVTESGNPKPFRIPEEAITAAERARNARAFHEDGFKS